MAHQNVASTISCQVNYFLENNNACNIFHVKATGPITIALLDTLNTIIQGWLSTAWVDNAAVGWTANEVILTGLNSLFDPRKSYPIGPPIEGGRTADPMPANVTIAVKEDIGRRGRGVAGRWFWVGLAEDQVVGNALVPARGDEILLALNDLRDLIAGHAGFEGIAVPHLVVDKGRPDPAQSDVITAFILSDLSIDTQKDRLPFHKKRKLKTSA